MSAFAARWVSRVPRRGAAGLASIGLLRPAHQYAALGDDAPPAIDGARRASREAADASFAVQLLGAATGLVYLIASAQLAGSLPATAAILGSIGLVQLAWTAASAKRARLGLVAGALLNALLVATWLLSRAHGLPGAPRQPVTALDALCALDSLAITLAAAALAWSAASPRRLRSLPGLAQLSILLAVASLSLLAAGHTHRAVAAGPITPAAAHFYCQLL